MQRRTKRETRRREVGESRESEQYFPLSQLQSGTKPPGGGRGGDLVGARSIVGTDYLKKSTVGRNLSDQWSLGFGLYNNG